MNEKLYTRFSSDQDFSDIDHIIIGSGIGGLTVATWLAKSGKKVVVFERHYVPGGFTHSFKRKEGFHWNVGVHYVGNVGEGEPLRNLFNLLTDNKLGWESMGTVYDVLQIDGDKYEFKAGEDAFRQQLYSYFPKETKTIDKYLRLIKKASRYSSAFFFEKTFEPFLSKSIGWIIRKLYARYSQQTTLEVLNSLTTNKRLIAVLCGQCGNYGLTPKNSSFAAHAVVINHFMNGGFYPKGGAETLSNYTLENLNKNGGTVYINADVQEIVTNRKRVKGVKVGDTFIPCKSVISNVGVDNTFNRLLSSDIRKRCKFDLKTVQPSNGHMCLYVGLDKSDAALNLPSHNVWHFDNDDLDTSLENITLKTAAQQFAYISFPSAKDPHWRGNHPDKATIQALTIGHYEWFSKFDKLPWMKRGEQYNQLKKEFEDAMLEQLYKLFPQIKGHVVVTEVSTPLSTKHFSNYKHGEIYGLAHSPNRFKLSFLRPKTKVKGLRLVGQDVTIVGVAGAMTSGVLCAVTILKFRVWRLFKEMQQMANK